ncbi:MAG: galactokinase [Halobacteria archaeon]
MDIFRSPGRVNLIGEHTDYTGGWVLPAAIDLELTLSASPSPRISLRSDILPGRVNFDPRRPLRKSGGWGDYVKGVFWALASEGGEGFRRSRKALGAKRGFTGSIRSTLPPGSGLSSSAALELLVGVAARHYNRLPITGARLARLCQRAENEFVGVPCGPMDQFAVALGRRDRALLLDCATLKHRSVPLPRGLAIGILNTGVPRRLERTPYARRRAEAEEAARLVGRPLREATARDIARLPGLLMRRARHVATENRRVVEMVDALRSGEREAAGRLMASSHRSLGGDFAVTIPELDAAVEAMRRVRGVWGARMTGAGFGGCAVALLDEEAGPRFLREAVADYRRKTGRRGRGWLCRAADGAGRVRGKM